MGLKQLTEAQRDFRSALQMILDGSQFSVEQLLVLAKRDRNYSEAKLRATVANLHPSYPASMNRVIVQTLWELIGTRTFVTEYVPEDRTIIDLIIQPVLEDVLRECPERFSRDDLFDISIHRRGESVAKVAAELYERCIKSVADRLLAEPAGLSETTEELKLAIRDLAFNSDLNEALSKVEVDMAKAGDDFDQKSLIVHLRTFYEKLHQAVGKELASKRPDLADSTVLSEFGNALRYLRQNDVITVKLEEYAGKLYGVLSNEGTHKLKAEREYVRFAWLSVIGYGRILLFELDRRIKLGSKGTLDNI